MIAATSTPFALGRTVVLAPGIATRNPSAQFNSISAHVSITFLKSHGDSLRYAIPELASGLVISDCLAHY
jgi:hypothetical protein